MTAHDHRPALATRAEIIHTIGKFGLAPDALRTNTLWELAATCGLHRIETREDRDNREIVETKQEYWDETREKRAEKLAGYHARRKARQLDRKRGKKDREAVGSN